MQPGQPRANSAGHADRAWLDARHASRMRARACVRVWCDVVYRLSKCMRLELRWHVSETGGSRRSTSTTASLTRIKHTSDAICSRLQTVCVGGARCEERRVRGGRSRGLEPMARRAHRGEARGMGVSEQTNYRMA